MRECFDVCGQYFGRSFEKEVDGYVDGSGKITSTTALPLGGMVIDSVRTLVKTADLLDCSTDYLLGRTDEFTQPAPAKGNDFESQDWNNGLPDKTGEVVALLESSGLRLKRLCWYDSISKDFYFSCGGPKIDAVCRGWIAVPE